MVATTDTTLDINIARKNSIVDSSLAFHGETPLFSVVEVNLLNVCTRKCDFCPISYPEYAPTKEKMSDEVMTALIESLKQVSYSGMIIFSGFCEPFLHKSLLSYVQAIRQALPTVRIEIISNGDLLTRENVTAIFAAGLSTLCISVYDGQEEFDRFASLRDEWGFTESQIVLRRRFYQDANYGFVFSNRSGCIKSDKYGQVLPEEFPLARGCNYPFYYTFVDVNGTVLSCPHDWFRKSSMGNVGETPLFSIWNGDRMASLRTRLLNSDRSAPQCAKCSTDGLVMGTHHLEAWRAIHAK